MIYENEGLEITLKPYSKSEQIRAAPQETLGKYTSLPPYKERHPELHTVPPHQASKTLTVRFCRSPPMRFPGHMVVSFPQEK